MEKASKVHGRPPRKFYELAPDERSTEDYLDLLQNWPYELNNQQRALEIGVIGAGMAGLVTAWLLRRAGHKVTIYEANNVVGGRVKTLRDPFTDGLYAEAGAMRVPASHSLTSWLIKDFFRLPTDQFKSDSDHALIYVNNQHVTKADYAKKSKPDPFCFDLEDYETDRTAEEIFEAIVENYLRHEFLGKAEEYVAAMRRMNAPRLSKDERERTRAILEKFDRLSYRSFLMEHAYLAPGRTRKLSAGGADMICALLGNEAHLQLSMAALVMDHYALHDDKTKLKQIRGGMDRLPKAFLVPKKTRRATKGKDTSNQKNEKQREKPAASMEWPNLGNILYNARVTELVERRPKIDVEYESPITRQKLTKRHELVVVAVPFSALRHIRTRDLMSPRKRRAVRQLNYDNSCKIILELDRPFWMRSKNGVIDGGCTITDLPIRQTFYPIVKQYKNGENRSLILASYTWGADSLRWTSLKKDDRIRFALRDLERVHKDWALELDKDLIGGMSHSWAEDEFTSGAFAMFAPFQMTDLFDDVWRSEKRIHYCGEHTSLKHGWIEGAVESGIRVAAEICERFGKDPVTQKRRRNLFKPPADAVKSL